MGARREITKKHTAEYARAPKKAKGMILDQLVATTGWSRADARRALTVALKRKGPAKAVKRKPRSRTYGYDTLKLLIQVWNLAGRPSGKYLAATMPIWLPKLEQHHELDAKRLNDHTRAQLLAVSGTKPGPLLRNGTRPAGDPAQPAITTASLSSGWPNAITTSPWKSRNAIVNSPGS